MSVCHTCAGTSGSRYQILWKCIITDRHGCRKSNFSTLEEFLTAEPSTQTLFFAFMDWILPLHPCLAWTILSDSSTSEYWDYRHIPPSQLFLQEKKIALISNYFCLLKLTCKTLDELSGSSLAISKCTSCLRWGQGSCRMKYLEEITQVWVAVLRLVMGQGYVRSGGDCFGCSVPAIKMKSMDWERWLSG